MKNIINIIKGYTLFVLFFSCNINRLEKTSNIDTTQRIQNTEQTKELWEKLSDSDINYFKNYESYRRYIFSPTECNTKKSNVGFILGKENEKYRVKLIREDSFYYFTINDTLPKKFQYTAAKFIYFYILITKNDIYRFTSECNGTISFEYKIRYKEHIENRKCIYQFDTVAYENLYCDTNYIKLAPQWYRHH